MLKRLGISVAVIAVALLLAVGSGLVLSQTPQRSAVVDKPAVAPSGRYQILFSPHVRADTFLLDTETGKIWHNMQITDVVGHPTIWKFETRFDNEQEYAAWAGRQFYEPDVKK